MPQDRGRRARNPPFPAQEVNMKLLLLLLFASPAHAECPAPPVKSSKQAVCYATAYAEKHNLPHRAGVSRKVTKAPKAWTVHHSTQKQDGSPGPSWEIDIDVQSATASRFKSYK